MDVTFTTQQVVDSEEHRLLMALKNSALNDEEAVQAFYQKVIQSLTIDGHYMILLAFDTYDVPYRTKDGETQEEAASEVYSYLVCSVCPVKMTKPALSYFARDNLLHNRSVDWVLSPPEVGFLFPAFDDRAANLYNALYYSRNLAENHEELAEACLLYTSGLRLMPPPFQLLHQPPGSSQEYYYRPRQRLDAPFPLPR